MSFVLAAITACKYNVLPFSSRHLTVSSAMVYFLSKVCANATLITVWIVFGHQFDGFVVVAFVDVHNTFVIVGVQS